MATDKSKPYRDAKDALVDARRQWAQAELARNPGAVQAAVARVDYAKGLVVATLEDYKGEPLAKILERNAKQNRPRGDFDGNEYAPKNRGQAEKGG